MPSFRLSAGRVGVQPAAELRHLQSHKYVSDVRGALLPVPCPESAVEPSPARCWHRGRPPPPASRPVARPAPYTLRLTRQGAKAFNQPLSFDTSSVTDMESMFYVRSSSCSAPNLQSSSPPHAACAAPSPSASQPAAHPAYMVYMFYVRSARALALTALGRALFVHAACAAADTCRPTSDPHLVPHHMPSFLIGRSQTPCPTPTSC